ncbi:hypothetical protein [Herminiimonas fonticola]|uniref:DUF4124 domain-containing protein n=1 Tax=Herminiimonas fonticola TaxID=303380 RepID=A0A4V3BUU1_9BURK|nr:hypothetical protein [Herminiimonas fonticola]RBA23602.1 hypothetical protein Hfont_2413 [Herminiimonas fonticola]TDN88008.1 hypothetical protein EV677_2878 [Herminiimonas fonticola]
MNIKYLLLIATALTFTQTASAQSRAYKCIVDGQTTYSKSACKIEATKQTTRDERETGKPSRATKPAGRNKYVCEAAKQDLANLDSMASQLNNSSVQDQVKERKAAVHKILYEWEC